MLFIVHVTDVELFSRIHNKLLKSIKERVKVTRKVTQMGNKLETPRAKVTTVPATPVTGQCERELQERPAHMHQVGRNLTSDTPQKVRMRSPGL